MATLIIDNYDSFTYNLYQMIQVLTDDKVEVYRNDALGFDAVRDMLPNRIILSPGPGHPGNDADFGVCKDIIRRQEELKCPVLGVCLGHQGIAHHLGGEVISAPEIVHGKSSKVQITGESPLFDGLPEVFEAMRYHSLIVSEPHLPKELQITAKEQNGGLIMAMQHRTLPLYGVQFHPESIGTPQGEQILRNFMEKC